MTLDVMSNSPFVLQADTRQWGRKGFVKKGEFDVTSSEGVHGIKP